MKAKLIFNLPEDTEDYETAVNGWKFKLVLGELDEHLRSKLKYSELTEGQGTAYQEARETLWVLINEQRISLH
jgi:hypothetical protein